jgi:hypothetical protein
MSKQMAPPISGPGKTTVWVFACAWLFTVLAPGLAPAQDACPTNPAATCPTDYAAKTCQDWRPSLEPPQVPNLVSVAEPENFAKSKRALTEYKCNGDYDNAVAEELGKAIDYVEHYDTGATQTAGAKTQLALVLDIDETALSNWPAILTDDYAFIGKGPCDLTIDGACGFDAWQLHAKDEVIAPTLKLFNLAKDKGISVFFITGRCDIPHMREATTANLRAAGYGDVDRDHLRMRPEECPHIKTVVPFKSGERAKIETDGHFRIIANVGDQWSDLDDGHSEKNFKVPNPFYFIP